MSERFIYTDLTSSEARIINKGVPQGGVLSPLLYCIYVANVTENLPKSVTVSQFADDVAIYCNRYRSTEKNKNLLQKAIAQVYNNFHKLGLELNPHKTVAIQFNNRNIMPGNIEIEVNNVKIKTSRTVRFLGIIFDYKLTFQEHIEQLQKKCLRSMNILKFLRGTWWGADADTLLTLYKVLFDQL